MPEVRPVHVEASPLNCPPGLDLQPWWSWAITEHHGHVEAARDHLLVWAPTLRGLPRWIPLEGQIAMLRSSVPLHAILRAHVPGIVPQQRAVDMPWLDLGLARIADLVVSETARRWASGGHRALAATALPPLQAHAAQWDVLLSRHAAALQHPDAFAASGDSTVLGLTPLLQHALVVQGWNGDVGAFEVWQRSHGGTGSGWQSPEQLAMWIWNRRRAELPWLPRRRTWPRRQTLRSWWRGERWIDIDYDPPIELEARDGGPPAIALPGVPAHATLTLSKAQARPYRGEPWLDVEQIPLHINEAALKQWWMRRISALGEAEAAWQPGPTAQRHAGGSHAHAVHLRIAGASHALPWVRKSALRARRAQRAAKTLLLWTVVLGLSSPLWVSLVAVLATLFKGVRSGAPV